MWPFRRKKPATGRRSLSPPPEENLPESAGQPFVVTDTLDLHGFFPQQVPEMVADFIDNAISLGLSRLRIVHGKGKSRMKWEVRQVLKEHPAVAKFTDAPPEAGGWGATIVYLRGGGKPA